MNNEKDPITEYLKIVIKTMPYIPAIDICLSNKYKLQSIPSLILFIASIGQSLISLNAPASEWFLISDVQYVPGVNIIIFFKPEL